jgi:hypothetical protein
MASEVVMQGFNDESDGEVSEWEYEYDPNEIEVYDTQNWTSLEN